jgi:flagellar basal body-associated protein FliL
MSAKKDENSNSDEKKGAPDPIKETGKKRKKILIAGISSMALASIGAGGFFTYKTFFQKKKVEVSAKKLVNEDTQVEDLEENHDAKPDENTGKDKKTDSKKEDHHGKADASSPDKFTQPDSHATSKAGDPSSATPTSGPSSETTGPTKFGDVFEITRMDLNLSNPLENRYLRIAVSLEHKGGKTQDEELAKRLPQLKDIIINSATKRSRMELLSEAGKVKLRKEIKNRMNESLEKPIDNIYFTEFLVE